MTLGPTPLAFAPITLAVGHSPLAVGHTPPAVGSIPLALGLWPSLTTTLSAVNVVLLAFLLSVWFRNYRKFNSTMILGLMAFAAVLLVENLVAIYFAFSMAMLYAASPTVQATVSLLRALQFLALVFLTWTTLR